RTNSRETDAANRSGQTRLRRTATEKSFILTTIDNHHGINDPTKNLRRQRDRETFSQLDEDQTEVVARKSGESLERSDHHRLRRERLDLCRTARGQVYPPCRRHRHEVRRASPFLRAGM